MKQIASFSVDHDKIRPGMYISRIDGDITSFDLRTRTPRSEVIKPADICSVITPVISEVIFMLEGMIAQIPEELAADLIDSGITVIGGGARMPKLAETLGEALQIPCFIADEPENAVVRGLAEILRRSNHFDALVTDRMARADRNR